MRFVLNLARRAGKTFARQQAAERVACVPEDDMLSRIVSGCLVEDFENDSWADETLRRLENRIRLAIATGCAREVLGALFAACIEEDFDNAIYAVAVLGRLEDRIRIAMASGVL